MDETGYLKDNPGFFNKLKQLPSLKLFSDKDLKGLLELSKIRKYLSGETIIKEGELDSWIYFLISGKLKVVKGGKDLCALQQTGELFGEMCIIDGSPRSASVVADVDSVCLATDVSFVDRVSQDDRIAVYYCLYRTFSEMLAIRLRATNEKFILIKENMDALEWTNDS